ncbi:MAG: hypothetical protein IJ323_01060 [Clostridia bacterium]|nr:hypothetical protein [Clostridia bacterium]
MIDRARNFVYSNTNYMSYKSLKLFYWGCIIIPICMLIMGFTYMKYKGVSFNSLFPLISIAVWTLLYQMLLSCLKSKRIKKTFELRFIVNGFVGIGISSLIWIFFASWNLTADTPFLKFKAFVWMIPIYVLLSALYIVLLVKWIHRRERQKSKTKRKRATVFYTPILLASCLGIFISRGVRDYTSLDFQYVIMIILVIAIIFVPIMAHGNFVKYYYCKKYNFTTDINGESSSPELEP